ncbi:MAG: GntR family transcriptional regulator, partial [Selenomonas sp.]
MLTYSFENIGRTPLYAHLYRCIRHDIETGVLQPGEKLPSKRALARHLGISTITVEGAYGQLMAEGYCTSQPKRGVYVSSEITRAAVA